MNSFINAMGPAGNTYTENGAYTPAGTGNPVADFFFHISAMRDADEKRIIKLFKDSFEADPKRTVRIMFYVRDIRGGQGERRIFRILLQELAKINPEWLGNNLSLIVEYGRWDDMFCLLATPVYKHIKSYIMTQLYTDLASADNHEPCSLLAKWMPSENASNPRTVALAKIFQRMLNMTPRTYRKNLSYLRKHISIVEHNLMNRDYKHIKYDQIPAKAGMKYRNAFIRNDREHYNEYIASVNKGTAKMNAGTLYPYEIVNKFFGYWARPSNDETAALDAMWKNLPNYVDNINGLVVADTSGSMYGRPMEVSVSLAMYIAERNQNEAFKDYFISFSTIPRFHCIKGDTITKRISSVTLGDVANTNIQAVFDLILARAKQYHVPEEEMPSVLYIVSDMEFDIATCSNHASNFEIIKRKYAEAGYNMPKLVFWNVNSRNNHTPVIINDRGVYLVSGCSPAIMKYAMNLSGSIMDLIDSVIDDERYRRIKY